MKEEGGRSRHAHVRDQREKIRTRLMELLQRVDPQLREAMLQYLITNQEAFKQRGVTNKLVTLYQDIYLLYHLKLNEEKIRPYQSFAVKQVIFNTARISPIQRSEVTLKDRINKVLVYYSRNQIMSHLENEQPFRRQNKKDLSIRSKSNIQQISGRSPLPWIESEQRSSSEGRLHRGGLQGRREEEDTKGSHERLGMTTPARNQGMTVLSNSQHVQRGQQNRTEQNTLTLLYNNNSSSRGKHIGLPKD